MDSVIQALISPVQTANQLRPSLVEIMLRLLGDPGNDNFKMARESEFDWNNCAMDLASDFDLESMAFRIWFNGASRARSATTGKTAPRGGSIKKPLELYGLRKPLYVEPSHIFSGNSDFNRCITPSLVQQVNRSLLIVHNRRGGLITTTTSERLNL